MKKIIVILNLIFLQSIYSNTTPVDTNYLLKTKTDIQFKTSRNDFTKKVDLIWHTKKTEINSVIINFNGVEKNYIVFEIKLFENYSTDELNNMKYLTGNIINENITNVNSFRGIKINYSIETENISKKDSIIIYELIDKVPVAKGCDKTLDNELQKKCFMNYIATNLSSNFDTSKFKNIGLKPGKHRVIVNFYINKKVKISNIIVNNDNKIVVKETTKLFESFKIISAGYNNGKPVNVKYAIPISFIIE